MELNFNVLEGQMETIFYPSICTHMKLTEKQSVQMLTDVQDSLANLTSDHNVKVTWDSVPHAQRLSVSSFFRYKNSLRMRN